MRERVELATKFGISFADGGKIRGDPAYVRACCEASLKRLDIDCIDLYYQHRVDTKIPIEVTVCPFLSISVSIMLYYDVLFFHRPRLSCVLRFSNVIDLCYLHILT